MRLEHEFPPLYNENSRILILGSFPSVKSRETQFYYGHPQNRFYKVLAKIFDEDIDPEVYVKENGLMSVNDEGELRSVIEKVIADNPKSVEDINSGKLKAMGFLVGQTMKEMKGKADPAAVNAILKEILGI